MVKAKDVAKMRKAFKQEKKLNFYASIFGAILSLLIVYSVVTTNHDHIKNGFNLGLLKTYGFTEGSEIKSDVWYIELNSDPKDKTLEAFCVEALVYNGSTRTTHSNIVVADTSILGSGNLEYLYKNLFGFNTKNISKAVPHSCADMFDDVAEKSEPYWHKAEFGDGWVGRSIKELLGIREHAMPIPRKKIELSRYIDYYENY